MNVSPTLRQRLDARREVRSPDECWPQTRGSVRILQDENAHLRAYLDDLSRLARAAVDAANEYDLAHAIKALGAELDTLDRIGATDSGSKGESK